MAATPFADELAYTNDYQMKWLGDKLSPFENVDEIYIFAH